MRLKIIDLGAGHQPITSDDGQTTIVFNGEVYNHAELRRELEAAGHRFHSRSDTEVVLHAFMEWDTECFARLNGMFAIALWNEPARRLVLARDRVGIKPLYVHRRGADLYFASELKSILAHPEVGRRLNLHALNHYLCLNYVPSPHTLVEGIEKLPPGQWLEWKDGAIRSAAYWRLKLDAHPRWTLEAAREELDALLARSVREHLISDVPLGIWASGGIDSSTILHYAAENAPGRLKTFSVSFRGRRFDESPYFREVSRLYGTDHHEFDLNPTDVDLPTAVEDLVYFSDEPSADAGALPVFFLSRMSRRHVTVALSGEGADELFGGYLTYRADSLVRLLARTPARARKLALRMCSLLPVSDEKLGLEYKIRRFLEGSLLDPDYAHCYWNGTFTPRQKERFFLAAEADGIGALFDGLADGNLRGLNRYLWFDQAYYLPDDILYKCDRMSMANSLEVRPPFLDHRIVEFAASLPEHLKIRGTRQKVLLRDLMKGKLPAAVLARRKEGFDIPAHEWLRSALRPLLQDTLRPETVAATGIFDAAQIQALVRNHLERRANLGFHLWGLLILFLWMRRWRIQTGPPAQTEATRPALSGVLS